MLTVTVEHPGTRNHHGELIPGTAAADDLLHGCLVAPRSSTEDNSLQASVFTGLVVYAPAGSAVPAAVDRLLIPGYPGRWEVDGDPGRWDLSSEVGGVEIPVRRAVG